MISAEGQLKDVQKYGIPFGVILTRQDLVCFFFFQLFRKTKRNIPSVSVTINLGKLSVPLLRLLKVKTVSEKSIGLLRAVIVKLMFVFLKSNSFDIILLCLTSVI